MKLLSQCLRAAAVLLLLGVLLPLPAIAQQATDPVISFNLGTGAAQQGSTGLSTTLQILLLFTVLSLAPAILVMTTSFVRIVIVLSFLRSALTLQQPSNQIVVSLALFLTFFIMAPNFERLNTEVVQPVRAGQLQADAALERSGSIAQEFMIRQVRESELKLFLDLAQDTRTYEKPEDLPLRVVIPAFMLSELKVGFQMGLLVLLPFLVIDLIVASTLMSLGMMMLPPTVVTLPLKLMVFVLADGWTLLVRNLVQSFN